MAFLSETSSKQKWYLITTTASQQSQQYVNSHAKLFLLEIKFASIFFSQILLTILVLLLILGIAVQLQFVPLVPTVQKYFGML